MIAASVLPSVEQLGALEPSAAPRGTGECERMYFLSCLILGTTRGKVRNTIKAVKAIFPIGRDCSEAKLGGLGGSVVTVVDEVPSGCQS